MIKVGDDVYCPVEGWSGEVVQILPDEDGDPAVAILRSHDPSDKPWIQMSIDGYRRIDNSKAFH